jgi:apolipoprotein N-acyltransferase
MVNAKSLFATLLASLIFSTGFAPLGLWLAIPVAYAIYLKVLTHASNLLLSSFLFGFIANAIILSWSKTFVGVTPWILLSVLQGLYLLPVGLLARYVKKPAVLIFALLIMDELKNYLPFGGFGWTRIAFSQVNSPLIPWVSVFGVIGVSLLTLIVALTLVVPNKYLIASLLTALIATPFIIQGSTENESLKIRAIQGGVPERGLSFNARAEAVLDNHIAVTRRDFQSSDDVIIWPENAIDVDPIRNVSARKKIENLQELTQIPLLAGAILSDDVLSNTAVLFDNRGSVQSTYVKRYLTPFGEYIPLRPLASLISPHVNRVTDFTPGRNFVAHKVGSQKISTVICYEILSDRIFRESAEKSGIIAVLTNSATFAGSAEGDQQMAITRIRAIETGRNIVSVSTTGPSAFIDYRGEVLQRLDDGEVGSISMTVEVRKGRTLAAQYGGFITIAVLLFALMVIAREVAREVIGRSRE